MVRVSAGQASCGYLFTKDVWELESSCMPGEATHGPSMVGECVAFLQNCRVAIGLMSVPSLGMFPRSVKVGAYAPTDAPVFVVTNEGLWWWLKAGRTAGLSFPWTGQHNVVTSYGRRITRL